LSSVPLLVMANKQDLLNAMSPDEVRGYLLLTALYVVLKRLFLFCSGRSLLS
jgi:signal recognition particle receptor subunit beta